MRTRLIGSIALISLCTLGACGKTEEEKFDERFKTQQADIEAQAKEMEEEADKFMKEQSATPPAS